MGDLILGNRHFRHRVLAIFQIFGVNIEKIKRRTLGVKEKVVRNDVLDTCTKILELYDSHCSFSGLKSNFACQ